jgi:hypothetical protein
VATVLLAEWSLTADYFDGAILDGPVPRFFVANPTEARAALLADASKAYKDIQRIYARLFITENIPACDAWAFVDNPRKDFVLRSQKKSTRATFRTTVLITPPPSLFSLCHDLV